MKKKQYIEPILEIKQIAMMSIIALSTPDDDEDERGPQSVKDRQMNNDDMWGERGLW